MLSDCWSASRTRTGPRSRAVGIARRPPLPGVELGRDVQQQGSRGDRLRLEPGPVEDRLPRRARLPVAVARRVVLRFESLRCQVVALVAGAPEVGEHVARPVVDRDERGIVDILAAQRPDPAALAARDLELLQQPLARAPLEVRCDDCGSDPALRQPLRPPVERRGHAVAGGGEVDVVAHDLLELALHLPGEMARAEACRLVACQDDGLVESRPELGRGQLGPARGRQVGQHPVPPDDRRRISGDDQVAVLVLRGVGIRIEGARRLGERG